MSEALASFCKGTDHIAVLAVQVPIPEPKLWFPDSPHLYDVDVWIVDKKSADASTAKDPAGAMDHVKCYTAMRKSALGKDRNGSLRLMLNDVFIFQVVSLQSLPKPTMLDCHHA